MSLRPYQEAAVAALEGDQSRCKALIMPTGSGKTRVALVFAQRRMSTGQTVAYVTESDALVKQVVGEAETVDLDARWIPGVMSGTAPEDVLENRKANLEDYDAGLILGVFTYASYFMGSNVPRASTLIIDDAHALVGTNYSQSVVEVQAGEFSGLYKRVLGTIIDANPTLSHMLKDLDVPVHRGGPAVLVPPPVNKEVRDTIRELVRTATEGTGYARFRLKMQIDASSPHFVSWPCVITADSIVWRPFIVPFESLGQSPGEPIPEKEVVLLTATDGPHDFLQTRLGLPMSVAKVPIPERIPEMGTRLIIPYEDLRSRTPPSQAQAYIIEACARKFGALLVTVISDVGEMRLRERLPGEIRVIRYYDRSTFDEFSKLQAPKVLVLVNRPVGVDVPSEVCRVAVHLDLPYSSSGHEVVAGDVERLGSVAEASLGVRLSQLLGRLNRNPYDRSAHFLLVGPLPLQRGSTFCQSLDPSVLLDMLIGQRGIWREYRLPGDELLDRIAAFLKGDDSLREEHRERQERARGALIVPQHDVFRPDATTIIEANLLLARGNFEVALQKFRRVARDADQAGSQAHAAFYEYQMAAMGSELVTPEAESFGPGGRQGVLQTALQRNPGSPPLVAALRQAAAGLSQPETGFPEAHTKLTLQKRALGFYERWITRVEEEAPSEESLENVSAWKEFWRRKLSAAEHTDLLYGWTDAFQLLGCDSPQHEESQNDARISWADIPDKRALAMEVKGRQSLSGAESTELTVDDVIQARDNATRIDADMVLLVTSKAKREREVPRAAKDRGVLVILEETATALADLLAVQCVALQRVCSGKASTSDVPFEMAAIRKVLQDSQDLVPSSPIRKLIPSRH
jgi:hypothetical protein